MGIGQPKAGIIGGTGRMGSWIGDLLEGLGIEVIKCGRSTPLRPEEVARICDIVVISVPIKEVVNVIRQVGPLVRNDAILTDLTSMKAEPIEAMLTFSRAQVVGLHPLFGPNAPKEGADLKVAVCPGRGKKALDWAIETLEAAGLKSLQVSPQVHDQLMSIIQGAQHFAMIAFAMTIMGSGYALKDLAAFATPSFVQTAERIRGILGQPSELFGALMMDNPSSVHSIHSHTQCVEELEAIVQKRDMNSFGELFLSLKQYFNEEETGHERNMDQGGSMGKATGHRGP